MPKGRKHQPNHFINFSPSVGHEQKVVLFARVSLFPSLFLYFLTNRRMELSMLRGSSVLSISRFRVTISAVEWPCLSKRSSTKEAGRVYFLESRDALALAKDRLKMIGRKRGFRRRCPQGRSPYPHPTAVRVRCGHCTLLNQKKYPVNLHTLRHHQFFTSTLSQWRK